MGMVHVFTMGEVTGVSAEVEINSYLQNLLSDYPDLPLVSPGATNPFWLATEKLLPHPRSDIHGISTSESMSNKHIEELPAPERTGESVRSRLAEQTDERVPPELSRSVGGGGLHTYRRLDEDNRVLGRAAPDLPGPNRPSDAAKPASHGKGTGSEQYRRISTLPEMSALGGNCPRSGRGVPFSSGLGQVRCRVGGSSPGSAISGGSEPPLFQFGRLEFDPDEQEIFRTAMVICDGALKP
ncbi:hypothetical protein N7453_006723 [Penicillium expansum]|nr:hypothetical protein N7453_006723 [Penicillium expansum]